MGQPHLRKWAWHNWGMSTVFEKIMAGELPGYFVYEDDVCVALMTIEPVAPGHTLVIPRQPTDKWNDLDAATLSHVMDVAKMIADAQEKGFGAPRSAVVIAGFEVPHAHVHVIPAENEAAACLSNAAPVPGAELEWAADVLRKAIAEAPSN